MFNVNTISHTPHIKSIVKFLLMRSSMVLSMVASCNNFCYLALRSATSFGRGRCIDQCFHEIHKKKLQGVTSEDLEYQGKKMQSSSVTESVFKSSRTQNAFSG